VLNNLLYSVNAVVPIVIMILLGGILKHTKFLDDAFFAKSEKLVFKISLPAMLFLEVAGADPGEAFDMKLIMFCLIGVFILFLTLLLIVPIFVKDNGKRGAFIQGVYRSNFAILGVPLAINMFGEAGSRTVATVMPFTIIPFNILAVLVLSIFAPAEKKLSAKQLLKKIVMNIVTNPLIIAVVLALPFMLWLPVPTIMDKSLTYLSNTTMALALMSLGANFSLEGLKGRASLSVTAAILKNAILPIIVLAIAIPMGFRNEQLGTILILFGAPTAVSSYIMAKGMGSDHELAGQIILFTTMLCIVTLFIFIFLLKQMGLI